MDVSVNPVLESVRPFFQGLPAPANPGATQQQPASVPAPPPSHPAAATPVQPSPHGPPASSPSVLTYWPQPQRTKDKSPALASPLHHVYNGTKLPEPQQPSAQHNLPPIAALSSNYHSRTVLRQTLPSHPPSSESPRTSHSQFRAPDYPQSNHHSIYSPPSNQSISRSSSGSSFQSMSKYQAPGSPAVSSPSPHAYSYSPRTSLPMSSATTVSSPAYPQTTSASSVYVTSSNHHKQQYHSSPSPNPQSRPPSNHQLPSHHPMSPVIQQPSHPQSEHSHLKLHQHQSQHSGGPHQTNLSQQVVNQHQQHAGGNSQLSNSHQQQLSNQPHHGQTTLSNNLQPHPTHQQQAGSQQHMSGYQQHQSSLQKDPNSHIQHSSSHHQNPPTSQQHSSTVQHTSSHQAIPSSLQQHPSNYHQHQSAMQQLSNIHQQQPTHSQPRSSTPQHHSSIHQQSHQQSSSHQQNQASSHHQSHVSEQLPIGYPQQPSGNQQGKPVHQFQHANSHQQHNSLPARPPSHPNQHQAQSQHPNNQHQPSHSQHNQQHGLANYQQQQKTSSQHQQNHMQQMLHQQQARHDQQNQQAALNHQQRQQMLSQQHHHQLQQQAAMYNQTVQSSARPSHQQQSQQQQQHHQQQQQQQQQQHQRDTEKLAEMEQMLRLKKRQLAAVQAQQQAYYAAASNNSSRPPSQSTTTTEASNHQRTTPTHTLGGVKRESPLDLSVKTVRQSADSTAKDDAESVYFANIQSHEAFLHRSKPSPKTSSPRSSVPPPLQLPSTIVYPHFENHTVNKNANSGAPKVDFLPNFNAHHSSSSSTNSGGFPDPNKRQRKSSTSQLPSSSQYPPRMGSLPHMGSFKRSSLPSAAYDDPNKQSQYYPATGPPNVQRSTAPMPNHSSANLQPSFGSTANNQYPYDPLKRGSSARYDILERHSSSTASSLESNYLLGKRQSSSTDLRHPLPSKIPKVVDTWRQTIDQQIEQRLNSYASSRGHQLNGVSKESSLPNSSGVHQQTASPYSSASTPQTSHSSATLPSSNSLIRSQSLFSSQLQNPSKPNLPSQYYPHSQSQYISQNMPTRSLQDPYNNLDQVKLPTLPSNGAADKRVLSILRKRLDTREATNQLAQQQMQQSSHQDRLKMYSSMGSRAYPQPMVVPGSQSKPPQVPHGRHNLPPFNALNLERNAAMAYPSQKLHIPKAMDSVVPDHNQNQFPPRTDVVPRLPLAPRTEVSGKPSVGENAADFDGLAAFLAARIRTKAELKQVGPSMDPQHQPRIPTPASASTSPRATPTVFSPPLNYPHGVPDLGKQTPTSESGASSSGLSSTSPLKHSRDKYGTNSPRRRLFGDLGVGGPSESVIQAREAGLRSSSETSVFDFRESDSEGEAGSERQSLTDMRKDRDRRLQERHQMSASSPNLHEVLDSEPIDDSFWSGMCDQFVTQLEKGGNKVRKRGRRKKLVDPAPEFETFETTEDALRAFYDVKPEETSTVIIKSEETSCSIIKLEEVSPVITKMEEVLPTITKPDEASSDIMAVEIKNIKVERIEDQNEEETQKEDIAMLEEKTLPPLQKIKVEEESSDEDAPLSIRQFELKKAIIKLENTPEKSSLVKKDSGKDKPFAETDKIKKDVLKTEEIKTKSIKKEITDSEAESSADETSESVAKRLRMRKPKEGSSKETKRKTRSREKETSEKENSMERTTTPQKGGRKKKEKDEKKKSFFGDGSEFRPGWEAEVYRYKRSLRMPTSLINIAGPQNWPSPKLSASLPDLDPDSPLTLDSDISIQTKKIDSDGESTPRKSKSPVSVKNKISQKKGEEKSIKEGEEDSFLNRLIQRYGGKGKKSLRKGLEKDSSKERKCPKIIPQSNELQLLPTPSLDCIVKPSPMKKVEQTQNKHSKSKKPSKDDDKSADNEIKESIFLGYFRKKTVADFSNVFAKHNGGFATEHELPPIMLKSRTRTQTRILTQRATIREVFGEDRPASAPPAACRENIEGSDKLSEEKSKKLAKKSKALLNKRNSTNGISGTRSGLRSAAVLRSNKAVLKSKQQLLHAGERRKRSKDLIKAFKTSKKPQQETKIKEETEIEPTIKCELQDISSKDEVPKDEVPVLVSEKRLKYRSVRRKLKSSGFDYIRKKKKQQQKKEGDTESIKEKKKTSTAKQNLESEEDIQNEIKGWVINKGLGETILHRAARLGYTDIAAYCLEKMDHHPSPRDNAGYTPLHEACSKGRLDIARLLLLYGADVSDSAQGGIRPLHEAAENGCLELIRLLLSYGADPLLATYSGLTPLSLTYNHPEARSLLQHHLSDVQGLLAPPWQIQLTDPTLLGNNPLEGAPSPEPAEGEVEVEAAELSLPHLYQLLGEPLTDRWVLFQELCPVLRVKTREALIKQLGPNHRGDFRDLKMTEFYDMARCCSVLGIGDFVLNPKAHKVTLVKYSERVQALLNSEKTMISVR